MIQDYLLVSSNKGEKLSMFIIIGKYLKPITEIECYLAAHRKFLDDGYQKNYFLASGPKHPRDGGIIISLLNDKNYLENVLANDPFLKKGLLTYDLIQFHPTKYHQAIKNISHN